MRELDLPKAREIRKGGSRAHSVTKRSPAGSHEPMSESLVRLTNSALAHGRSQLLFRSGTVRGS